MNPDQPMTYAQSGVDIDASNMAKKRIKELVRSTFNNKVLTDVGLFGGLYQLDPHDPEGQVLVASADGVGTKLKIAFMTGIHNTVGYDLVAHCVNDILVQGARPMFFLDYFATGRLEPAVVAHVIEGLVRGCREAGCALIGGETAEMPDFYPPGEYDLAGFIVGSVNRSRLLTGSRIRPGDRVLGLPSLGLHTNGYSLARAIFFERSGLSVDSHVAELGCTVGEELLKPHKNYLPALEQSLAGDRIQGMAHITGGGLVENIPRILPQGCAVELDSSSWEMPPVFRFLESAGNVPREEMVRVFNMGIGMAVICRADDEERVLGEIGSCGETAFRIGRVVAGAGEVGIL